MIFIIKSKKLQSFCTRIEHAWRERIKKLHILSKLLKICQNDRISTKFVFPNHFCWQDVFVAAWVSCYHVKRKKKEEKKIRNTKAISKENWKCNDYDFAIKKMKFNGWFLSQDSPLIQYLKEILWSINNINLGNILIVVILWSIGDYDGFWCKQGM